MLRDHGFIVMSLTLPVVMYLLFSNLGLGAQTTEAQAAAAAWSMVAMAAYGALGGAFSNGTGTSEDKALGWLAQLSVLPIRPWRVIAGKAAHRGDHRGALDPARSHRAAGWSTGCRSRRSSGSR